MLSRLSVQLLLAYTVTACAMYGQSANPSLIRRDLSTLEVTNKNWEDLAVYITKGESEMRLGLVPGLSTRRLYVPAPFIASGTGFRLFAGPRGAPRTYFSELFDVVPGRSLFWTVEYRLTATSVMVR